MAKNTHRSYISEKTSDTGGGATQTSRAAKRRYDSSDPRSPLGAHEQHRSECRDAEYIGPEPIPTSSKPISRFNSPDFVDLRDFQRTSNVGSPCRSRPVFAKPPAKSRSHRPRNPIRGEEEDVDLMTPRTRKIPPPGLHMSGRKTPR